MFFLVTLRRDGRIKVIGGDNIEAILASPKQLPFKNLEVCGILLNKLRFIFRVILFQCCSGQNRCFSSILSWRDQLML